METHIACTYVLKVSAELEDSGGCERISEKQKVEVRRSSQPTNLGSRRASEIEKHRSTG